MICLATAADFNLIAELSDQAYLRLKQDQQSMYFNWTYDKMLTELKVADRVYLFKDASSAILAFVVLRKLADAWEITALLTQAHGRAQGVMTHLLQQVFAQLSGENGPDQVWLEVHEQNQPAIGLYRKLGMAQVGRRPRYYADSGAALLFSLSLSSSNNHRTS